MQICPSYLDVKDKDIRKFMFMLEAYNKNAENIKISHVHVDIMDGEFVPNVGVDIDDVRLIRNKGYMPDVHLMVAYPESYIDKAIENGANIVCIHVELPNVFELISFMQDKCFEHRNKVKIGLAINPSTSYLELEKYLPYIDHILVMSVEPGKGGQSFIDLIADKIENIKNMIINAAIFDKISIAVDGGINDSNIALVKKKGADLAVVGSYVARSQNLKEFEDKMRTLS
ncbi:MAG: ribulose-phosphate 3-epimerase [Clostridia bacterium]